MAVKGPVRPALSLEVTGQQQEHVAGEVPLPRYSLGPLQEEAWDTDCHVHFACGHDKTAAGMWCRRPCGDYFSVVSGKTTRKSKQCWFPA